MGAHIMSHIVRSYTTFEIEQGSEKRVLNCETRLSLSELVAGYDATKFNELIEEARDLMENTGHDSATIKPATHA
jgi:hypothetical protein